MSPLRVCRACCRLLPKFILHMLGGSVVAEASSKLKVTCALSPHTHKMQACCKMRAAETSSKQEVAGAHYHPM